MDNNLRYEIDRCIRELRSIVEELYDVARAFDESVDGFHTSIHTSVLKNYAEKYSRAANKLSNIE